jgi:hypothetical protein
VRRHVSGLGGSPAATWRLQSKPHLVSCGKDVVFLSRPPRATAVLSAGAAGDDEARGLLRKRVCAAAQPGVAPFGCTPSAR